MEMLVALAHDSGLRQERVNIKNRWTAMLLCTCCHGGNLDLDPVAR